MNRLLLLLCLFLAVHPAIAQQNSIVLQGKILDSETSKGIPNASVTLFKSLRGTSTNRQGEFWLAVSRSKGAQLNISHIGYELASKTFSGQYLSGVESDTLILSFYLLPKAQELAPVAISSSNDPDTVFGSAFYSVSDFVFEGDGLLLLTYNRNLKKDAQLVLTDKNQQPIAERFVKSNPRSFFTDYLGRHFLLCEHKVLFVQIEGKGRRHAPVAIFRHGASDARPRKCFGAPLRRPT